MIAGVICLSLLYMSALWRRSLTAPVCVNNYYTNYPLSLKTHQDQ
jgi:hypothetical protein